MPAKHKVGYDVHILYSIDELIRMYIDQDMDMQLAKIKAKEVYTALHTMSRTESRLWARVRENELTDGLEPEYIEGSNI